MVMREDKMSPGHLQISPGDRIRFALKPIRTMSSFSLRAKLEQSTVLNAAQQALLLVNQVAA